jgi:ubiquitin-protein ligase
MMPVGAANQSPEEYIRKVNAVNDGKAALLRNLQMMDKCEEEIAISVEAVIRSLAEYRETMLEVVRKEKAELAKAIDAAIEEAESCIVAGCTPSLPLAKALWTLSPEELGLFTYIVVPPDIKSLLGIWLAYEFTLPDIIVRFKPMMHDYELEEYIFGVGPGVAELFGYSVNLPCFFENNKCFCRRVQKEISSCNHGNSRSIIYGVRVEDAWNKKETISGPIPCVRQTVTMQIQSYLRAELLGPEDSPYAGLIFTLMIGIPEDYPFKPYKIRFMTPIYHPNITVQGDILADFLETEWSLTLTIRTTLLMIGALMATPIPECIGNEIAAKEYLSNPSSFAENTRRHALRHAKPQRVVE